MVTELLMALIIVGCLIALALLFYVAARYGKCMDEKPKDQVNYARQADNEAPPSSFGASVSSSPCPPDPCEASPACGEPVLQGSSGGDQLRPCVSCEVTPKMVKAGIEVLLESGRLTTDYPVSSDDLLVSEVFRAMLRALSEENR